MADSVGSVVSSKVRKIRTKTHLQIDDRDGCMARRGQDSGGGANGSLNHGNINAKPVEHATSGAIVILHIDNEERTPCRIDGDWLRLGSEPYHLALRVNCEMVFHGFVSPG